MADRYPEFKQELPAYPHKMFDEPLGVLLRYYKEHITRGAESGALKPGEAWFVLRGLLVAAGQTYAAICIILADKRPKPLMLQAGILCRSLLENLGNVLALCEAPKSRAKLLLREAYRDEAIRYRELQTRYGQVPKWKEYLDVMSKGLTLRAKHLGLSRIRAKRPESIPGRWPMPGPMVYGNPSRKISPFLRGSRRRVLKELYDSHYGRQSEQAHQRIAAVGVALIVDQPEHQWNPGAGESDIVSTAILLLACIISELEAKGGFPPHPRLRELWTYLRDIDDEAKEVWRLRSRALVGRAG